MDEASFSFDGRILGELSTQIPSDVFALNELIKNSYDAMAGFISISLDTREKTLVIADDGSGMGGEQIQELFHISHSSKEYGRFDDKSGRYIQGSKGLGFLSAFRFGTQVSWETIQDGMRRCFTVRRDEAMRQEDLSELPIRVHEERVDGGSGTIITIALDDQSCTNLEQKFNNSKVCDRLIYSFLPCGERRSQTFPDIKIRIDVNGKTVAERNSPRLQIHEVLPGMQRAEVFYDSTKADKATVYRHGEEYPSIYVERKPARFDVSVHLVYFKNVKKNENSGKQIPPLFQPEDNSAPTIPQIYINENLFDSLGLFDPQINRSQRNTESAPQFIGYVNVYSPDIRFNPDRTQLTETPLNEEIKKFLEALNRTLQKRIARIPPLMDDADQPVGNGEDGKRGKDEARPHPASEDDERAASDTFDTSGKVQSSSQRSPLKLLLHSFTSPVKPLRINSNQLQYPLIKLVQQINQLGKNDKLELVACGLRIFFELPTAELSVYQGRSKEVGILSRNIAPTDPLQDKVKTVLTLIYNGTGATPVSNALSLSRKDAKQLRNDIGRLLDCNADGIKNQLTETDIQKVSDAMENSNLGMHRGPAQLSDDRIREIADAASKFAAIVDALLQL